MFTTSHFDPFYCARFLTSERQDGQSGLSHGTLSAGGARSELSSFWQTNIPLNNVRHAIKLYFVCAFSRGHTSFLEKKF